MSAFWTPRPLPPDLGPLDPVRVYRLDATGYTPLPHVQAVSASFREGPNPGMAQCVVRFDQRLTELLGCPQRFEDVFGLNAPSPWSIRADDRIVFVKTEPDGSPRIVFDGFASAPQLDLSSGQERVTFSVAGTPVREWDRPIPGARWRDARVQIEDDWESGDEHAGDWSEEKRGNANDIPTDLPTRFNPDGRGNQTRVEPTVEGNVTVSGKPDFMTYPVFRDTGTRDQLTDDAAELWTLATVARYLIGIGNPVDEWTSTIELTAPSVTEDAGRLLIDDILSAWAPTAEEGSIWLLDPDSWKRVPVPCQDIDVTGKSWPEALADVLAPHGFTFTWRLGQKPDPEGLNPWPVPNWELDIYPVAYPPITRSVALQAAGGTIDPGQTNLASATLSLDTSATVGQWRVDTEPTRFEVTVALLPAFEPKAEDATPEARKAFVGNKDTGDPRYRDFILGEGGDEWWFYDPEAGEPETEGGDPPGAWIGHRQPPATDIIFRPERGSIPETIEDDSDTIRRNVRRRRPPIRELITRDTATNQPMTARIRLVEWSEYTGSVPGVFDETKVTSGHTLQEVTQGAWELLPDRCGIRITASDPNDWRIGEPADRATTPFPKGVVNVVQCLGDPGADGNRATKRFLIVLTCVLEGDRGLNASADQRPACPRQYAIERRDDARDRYRREIRTYWSEHYDKEVPEGEEPIAEKDRAANYDTGRDDTDTAIAHAESRRQGHEAARLAGSLTIRRLTMAYRLGEAVGSIDGRSVSLDTLAGRSIEEQPRYPVIVGIDYTFGAEISTTLQLEDRRVEPVRIGREGGFRRA